MSIKMNGFCPLLPLHPLLAGLIGETGAGGRKKRISISPMLVNHTTVQLWKTRYTKEMHLIGFVVIIAFLSSPLFADTIKLRDGTDLNQKIVKRSEAIVTTEVNGIAIDVKVEQIDSINGAKITHPEEEKAAGTKKKKEEEKADEMKDNEVERKERKEEQEESKRVAKEKDGPAPEKFIPSFGIWYGPVKGWQLEEVAKFDFIVTGAAKRYASPDGKTWQILKRINPHLIVVLYQMGPGEYDTARGSISSLGEGWDWLKAHHGIGSADRWTAVGTTYGEYLQISQYPAERLMFPGNPNWQQYWLDETYAKFWDRPPKPGEGADGIFADNTQYTICFGETWFREGHPDQRDLSRDYYRDGKFLADLWQKHINQFLNRVTPRLGERGIKLVLNFCHMGSHPEYWDTLDALPHPPFAAMEEGAFFHPWGKKNEFSFLPEQAWLNQVETMHRMKNVRMLMTLHGPVISNQQDVSRMDASDAAGRRAWDVFWYGLTSFLMGYNDEQRNAYVNFCVWDHYAGLHWFDEFDPKHLHLGGARGAHRRTDGVEGYVYLREFEDGWVAANPTEKEARGVPVPAGRARVLTHDTFQRADAAPLVERFDLPAHRGVILLKHGRSAGNADN